MGHPCMPFPTIDSSFEHWMLDELVVHISNHQPLVQVIEIAPIARNYTYMISLRTHSIIYKLPLLRLNIFMDDEIIKVEFN